MLGFKAWYCQVDNRQYFGSESKGVCPLCAAMDRIEELETEITNIENDAVDINEQMDLQD